MFGMNARKSTRFFYARHGETDWNVERLFIGQTDVPLNERGLDQAETLAAAALDRGITAIYTSPLKRALQTASIVAAKLRVPVHIVDDLAEVGLGALEGTQETQVDFFAQWENGNLPIDVETYAGFQRRVIDAVASIIQKSSIALVISHSAVYYALSQRLGRSTQSETPNAKLVELTWPQPKRTGQDHSIK